MVPQSSWSNNGLSLVWLSFATSFQSTAPSVSEVCYQLGWLGTSQVFRDYVKHSAGLKTKTIPTYSCWYRRASFTLSKFFLMTLVILTRILRSSSIQWLRCCVPHWTYLEVLFLLHQNVLCGHSSIGSWNHWTIGQFVFSRCSTFELVEWNWFWWLLNSFHNLVWTFPGTLWFGGRLLRRRRCRLPDQSSKLNSPS